MSGAARNGVAPAQEPDPLSKLIARLPDPEDREWFRQLVAYVHSLPADDEFVKVAQLFGFLTLLGRDLPEALVRERHELREFLSKAYQALEQEVKTNASYHVQLNERLSKLPGEIAAGVNPADIAKAMAESFRQQIAASGLEETRLLLASATSDLKRVTRDLDDAVKPLTDHYGNLANHLAAQATNIEVQTGRLIRTAEGLNKANSQLLREVNSLQWHWYATVAIVLIMTGFFGGITFEKRTAADVVGELQSEFLQLQESFKALPPRPAASNGKRARRGP